MRVMLGYDPSEDDAYKVARFSIERRASSPVRVSPIILGDLQRALLYTRPMGRCDGQLWDAISCAPMSSEFAISRFFVPLLVDSDDDEWVLFADSDIVCFDDIFKLFELRDDSKAIMVVKHVMVGEVGRKKVNKLQSNYPFKNWSSVMLFNVKHEANKKLTVEYLNRVPGRELHSFAWLDRGQIGALPFRWNWLVGIEDQMPDFAIAHFTLGGPWLDGWQEAPHDGLWLEEKAEYDRAITSQSAEAEGRCLKCGAAMISESLHRRECPARLP
ncbi:RfaJ Lipopolysaccharide biosynthesis proteins, LPS,glycosyltransferases [uncultured Caudovirales phage]|uniref:RfaJ Lipopolysaccharide biosynthesis proteins, LPS,glycosyltransferases n=1 Tax=uncultured Caudovirales phage TaxID=2100421 RepID=A0A6J5R9T5_9CAUD|nr:RfaJ Lipopolysaccharide biosynthesis proteins, LPS,glycosyltransferases [uncultured Caudovirales phage]